MDFKGRRVSMVTFLSMTIINRIIELINYEIKSEFSSEIKKAGKFTVLFDLTQVVKCQIPRSFLDMSDVTTL